MLTATGPRVTIPAVRNLQVPVWVVTATFLAAAGAAVILAPPDAFFSSDEGVKFIQVNSLAASGFRDAAIRWPGAASAFDLKYAEAARFIERRRGELFSPHPFVFALASAPAWLLLGFRGLYVLPALSGAACLLLTVRLASRFGVRRTWLPAALLAFATPLFFYSVTFWEHTAAVALWLGGWVLTYRRRPGWFIVAGALWGLAASLRPEAAWLWAWSVAAQVAVNKGTRVMTALRLAAGTAIAVSAVEIGGWLAFSQPPFFRFAANLSYGVIPHAGEYLYALNHSILPLAPWYLGVAGVATVAAAVAARWWRPAAYVAAGVAVVLVGLYLRFYAGFATALPAAFPAAFALFFFARADVRRALGVQGREKAFYVVAGGFAASLFVVVADTSGYAWGPRFLLFVFPVAALALARTLEVRAAGRDAPRLVFTCVLIAASIAMQVFAYGRLAGTRAEHAAMVRDVRRDGAPTVITNKWYLPLFAAADYSSRAYVIVTDEADIPDVASTLRRRGEKRAVFLGELPVNAAAAADYELGMTDLLSRSFDVRDCRPVGEAERRFTPPVKLWMLDVRESTR